MDDFLFGAVSVVAGVMMIVWRKPLAARQVREQNWFWRANHGSRRVAQQERALVLVGIFSFALGLSFWFW
jgi:hypothetical protein